MYNPHDETRFIPASHVTALQLRRRTGQIARTVQSLGDQPVDTLREHELLAMLDDSEGICRIIRQALSMQGSCQQSFDYAASRAAVTSFMPLNITFDGGILRIHAPLTYRRDMKNSWYLSECLGTCMRDYIQTHGTIAIDPPVYAVVRRRVPAITCSMRDNENLEVSRMLNTIFSFLGYSDRCDRVAYSSLAETSASGHGTYITIINASRIAEIIGELIPGGHIR